MVHFMFEKKVDVATGFERYCIFFLYFILKPGLNYLFYYNEIFYTLHFIYKIGATCKILLGTIFTLSIGTHYLLTILVLEFEIVHSSTC